MGRRDHVLILTGEPQDVMGSHPCQNGIMETWAHPVPQRLSMDTVKGTSFLRLPKLTQASVWDGSQVSVQPLKNAARGYPDMPRAPHGSQAAHVGKWHIVLPFHSRGPPGPHYPSFAGWAYFDQGDRLCRSWARLARGGSFLAAPAASRQLPKLVSPFVRPADLSGSCTPTTLGGAPWAAPRASARAAQGIGGTTGVSVWLEKILGGQGS